MTQEHLLEDRIAAFNAALAKQAPEAVVKTINEEIAKITAPKALWIGDRAPAFMLPDARGGELSLEAVLKQGPAVIAFYRGQWCPYCDLQLRAYQEALSEIRALGATLIAISPQTQDESTSTVDKRGLSFAVLSDRNNAVARSYGVAFKLSAAMDALQKGFGVDLAKANGDAGDELPVPAVFIVAKDGRIAFAHVDTDFRRRLEPAAIVRELERLA
jgi:peroxiredoxin